MPRGHARHLFAAACAANRPTAQSAQRLACHAFPAAQGTQCVAAPLVLYPGPQRLHCHEDAANVPGRHAVQLGEPGFVATRPRGHVTHVEPHRFEDRPRGQALHALAPDFAASRPGRQQKHHPTIRRDDGANFPGRHGKQGFARARTIFPAAQRAHRALPRLGLVLPGPHAVHALVPPWEKVPTGQSSHACALALKRPAGQAPLHVLVPSLKRPSGHAVHDSEPSFVAVLPAGHGTQWVLPGLAA